VSPAPGWAAQPLTVPRNSMRTRGASRPHLKDRHAQLTLCRRHSQSRTRTPMSASAVRVPVGLTELAASAAHQFGDAVAQRFLVDGEWRQRSFVELHDVVADGSGPARGWGAARDAGGVAVRDPPGVDDLRSGDHQAGCGLCADLPDQLDRSDPMGSAGLSGHGRGRRNGTASRADRPAPRRAPRPEAGVGHRGVQHAGGPRSRT